MRVSATAAPGLAAILRYVAHHRRKLGSAAIDGARSSRPTGPPQLSRISSRKHSRSASVGPQGYVRSRIRLAYGPIITSASVFSGQVAANRADIAAPSDTPHKTARFDPAASI